MKTCSKCDSSKRGSSKYTVWSDVYQSYPDACSKCLADGEWHIFIHNEEIDVRPSWYRSQESSFKHCEDVRKLYKEGIKIQFQNISDLCPPYYQLSTSEVLIEKLGVPVNIK